MRFVILEIANADGGSEIRGMPMPINNESMTFVYFLIMKSRSECTIKHGVEDKWYVRYEKGRKTCEDICYARNTPAKPDRTPGMN